MFSETFVFLETGVSLEFFTAQSHALFALSTRSSRCNCEMFPETFLLASSNLISSANQFWEDLQGAIFDRRKCLLLSSKGWNKARREKVE